MDRLLPVRVKPHQNGRIYVPSPSLPRLAATAYQSEHFTDAIRALGFLDSHWLFYSLSKDKLAERDASPHGGFRPLDSKLNYLTN